MPPDLEKIAHVLPSGAHVSVIIDSDLEGPGVYAQYYLTLTVSVRSDRRQSK